MFRATHFFVSLFLLSFVGCGEEDLTLIQRVSPAEPKKPKAQTASELEEPKPRNTTETGETFAPTGSEWKSIFDQYYFADYKEKEDLEDAADEIIEGLLNSSGESFQDVAEFRSFIHENYDHSNHEIRFRTLVLQDALRVWVQSAEEDLHFKKEMWKWAGLTLGAGIGILWAGKNSGAGQLTKSSKAYWKRFGRNLLVIPPSTAAIGYTAGRVISQFYDEESQIQILVMEEPPSSAPSGIFIHQLESFFGEDWSPLEVQAEAQVLSESILTPPASASEKWNQVRAFYEQNINLKNPTEEIHFRAETLEREMKLRLSRYNVEMLQERAEIKEFYTLAGSLIGAGTFVLGFKALGGQTARAYALRSFLGLTAGHTVGHFIFSMDQSSLEMESALD